MAAFWKIENVQTDKYFLSKFVKDYNEAFCKKNIDFSFSL
jgi:hypothetical protein